MATITTVSPIIKLTRHPSPEQRQAYREHCRAVRLRLNGKKGLIASFVRDVIQSDTITAYANFRNAISAASYNPAAVQQFEAYLDRMGIPRTDTQATAPLDPETT